MILNENELKMIRLYIYTSIEKPQTQFEEGSIFDQF